MNVMRDNVRKKDVLYTVDARPVDSDGRTPELAARSLHTRTSTDIYEGWDLDDHRQYMIHNRAPTSDRG